MLRKMMIGLMTLAFAALLVAPATAHAGVVVGVGVGPVVRPYGYVGVRPYVAPAPYVAVAPGYVAPYVYPGPVVVSGRWYPRPYAYRVYGYRGHPYGWRR